MVYITNTHLSEYRISKGTEWIKTEKKTHFESHVKYEKGDKYENL